MHFLHRLKPVTSGDLLNMRCLCCWVASVILCVLLVLCVGSDVCSGVFQAGVRVCAVVFMFLFFPHQPPGSTMRACLPSQGEGKHAL